MRMFVLWAALSVSNPGCSSCGSTGDGRPASPRKLAGESPATAGVVADLTDGRNAVVARARDALARMQAYEARIVHETEGQALFGEDVPHFTTRAESHLRVQRPDKLYLTTEMGPPLGMTDSDDPDLGRMSMTVIFDGDAIWLTSRSHHEVGAVQRADARRVRRSSRPFDSYLALRGTGLERGEDLAGTVQALLDRYTFDAEVSIESVTGQLCHRLNGSASSQRMLDEILADPAVVGGLVAAFEAKREDLHATALEVLARQAHMTRRLSLWVEVDSGLPRRWTLGSDGAVAFRTQVTELIVRERIPPNVFALSPQAQASATDVTDQTVANVARARALEPAAEAVARLRDRLRAALEEVGRTEGTAAMAPASEAAPRPRGQVRQ